MFLLPPFDFFRCQNVFCLFSVFYFYMNDFCDYHIFIPLWKYAVSVVWPVATASVTLFHDAYILFKSISRSVANVYVSYVISSTKVRLPVSPELPLTEKSFVIMLTFEFPSI
jgi:hypothetical protein